MGDDPQYDSIVELLDASSLGTPEAERHRRMTPTVERQRIMALLGLSRSSSTTHRAATGHRPPLRRGDVSVEVRRVQSLLAELGRLPPEGMTGIFDDATVYALVAFQTQLGLEPTGQVDERTDSSLGGEVRARRSDELRLQPGSAGPPAVRALPTRRGNHQLRAVREAMRSRVLPGHAMTRGELGRLVVEHLRTRHGIEVSIDGRDIAELEAGGGDGPDSRYREALRTVLGVMSDEALGFRNAQLTRPKPSLDAADERLVAAVAEALEHSLSPASPPPLNPFLAAVRNSFGSDRLSDDNWIERVEGYGYNYMETGATDLQGRLTAELVRLQPELSDRPVLWWVAARLLTIAGLTLPQIDGRAGALHWYELGIRASERCGDTQTRVWVRGRAALALAYEGAAPGWAGSLAQDALDLSDRPSLGRLNALLARAHVEAFAGRREDALRSYRQALDLFHHVGSDEQASDFAMPEWRMNVISSLLLARLGEEDQAVDAQSDATRTMPSTLTRYSVHLELHRGLMLARFDPDAGFRYAQDALSTLSPSRQSRSLSLMMDEIAREA